MMNKQDLKNEMAKRGMQSFGLSDREMELILMKTDKAPVKAVDTSCSCSDDEDDFWAGFGSI